MDLGVGGFIFSNGFVAGPRLRTHQSSIAKSVAISLPILLLGFARLVSTRSVEYHEHVSEYGVHWNFFVTLGLIPVLTAILQSIVPKMHFGLMGAVIMAIYEYVLTQRGLQAYIFDAKREGNFFQLNREGICSFFGYWAIFFVAAHVGERILTTPEQLSMKEAPILAAYNRKKKSGNASDSDETTSHDVADQKASNEFSIDLVNIIDLISILTALLTLFAFVRYELHHQVSRRVANMSYCLWVICVSLSLVLGTLLVDYLFTQWFNPDESSLLEAVVITEAESSSTTKSRSKSKSTTRGSRSISKNQDLQQRRKRSKSHSRGISQARGRSRSKQVPLDGADDQETKVSEQHRIKLEAVKEYIHRLRTPLIFDCINRNQLAVFLLANILTGLVNLSIDTLSVPSHVAMGILVAYLAVVIAAAVWWNEMGWNLNLNSFVIGGGSSAKKRSKVDKVE
ncbi:GWT1-domain-containing protein [Obelidium mucronatum]|nr:GWT1-domain-containing protein [Obelidium mucronatum]